MQRLRWPAAIAAFVFLIASSANDADAQRRRRTSAEPGTLTIQTTAEGAEVLVDEESVGFTPLEQPIRLAPGTHTVRVRRPGYTEFTDVVRIQAGRQVDLPVDLMALSMVLTVRSDPDESRVFVDGTFRGTTPIEVELIEGEHSIRVTHPGHHEAIRQVQARAGETEAIDVALEALPPDEVAGTRTPEWYEDPIVWVAVGAGAVVVAVTIVLVAVLTQGGSQINDFCGGAAEQTCIRVMPEWSF